MQQVLKFALHSQYKLVKDDMLHSGESLTEFWD